MFDGDYSHTLSVSPTGRATGINPVSTRAPIGKSLRGNNSSPLGRIRGIPACFCCVLIVISALAAQSLNELRDPERAAAKTSWFNERDVVGKTAALASQLTGDGRPLTIATSTQTTDGQMVDAECCDSKGAVIIVAGWNISTGRLVHYCQLSRHAAGSGARVPGEWTAAERARNWLGVSDLEDGGSVWSITGVRQGRMRRWIVHCECDLYRATVVIDRLTGAIVLIQVSDYSLWGTAHPNRGAMHDTVVTPGQMHSLSAPYAIPTAMSAHAAEAL